MCLDYDLSSHPELCADLTKFASALLPHERGDSGSFHILLDIVTRMIRTQEMETEYFPFFSVAEKLEQVSFLTKSKPVFLRDVFDTILNANLYEVIQKDGQGFAAMMAEEGKASDFLIEQNVQEAASLAKRRAMELYDDAFDLQVSPDEAIGYTVSLTTNYCLAVSQEAIQAQSLLVNGNEHFPNARYDGWYQFLGRKKFKGASGWLEFVGFVNSALAGRLSDASQESKPLMGMARVDALMEDVTENRSAKIGLYGIPPIDNPKQQIMKTRYVVLIGKPNLGKTTIAVNWLVNVFLEGKRVAIFSEETVESIMLFKYVLPVYIYKKYGFFASYEQIVDQEEVGGVTEQDVAERKKMIKMAIDDIGESGRFLYISRLNALTIRDDLARIYSDFPFDYCVIDHSLSLGGVSGGGDKTTPILDAMSRGIKEFKNTFKTSICLLSHPSPDAKKIVSREGAFGLTKYSKQIEGDADDVFYMFDTPELEERNLIAFIQTKGREAAKVLDVMYLTKVFEYKVFRYDPAVQQSASSADVVLSAIPGEEDDDDDEE